ncbi:hypothetical protein SBA2_60018 [Acidobacteriia bacterium SbA2]|nr:hypothetical protein SBA2_60018 [Acidobacteriia bacterium SbA2]
MSERTSHCSQWRAPSLSKVEVWFQTRRFASNTIPDDRVILSMISGNPGHVSHEEKNGGGGAQRYPPADGFLCGSLARSVVLGRYHRRTAEEG